MVSVINNLSYFVMDISFNGSLLTATNGQLGILVYKSNEINSELEFFTSFDTPMSVETVLSKDNFIFSGLKYDYGCYITLLDDNGLVSNTLQIADGYSIKGIDVKSDLVSLATGYDGVLLYQWDGFLGFTYIGKIETEYAYSTKIYNENTIFVGTRAGVQIIYLNI